jgi:hypothetical protein
MVFCCFMIAKFRSIALFLAIIAFSKTLLAFPLPLGFRFSPYVGAAVNMPNLTRPQLGYGAKSGVMGYFNAGFRFHNMAAIQVGWFQRTHEVGDKVVSRKLFEDKRSYSVVDVRLLGYYNFFSTPIVRAIALDAVYGVGASFFSYERELATKVKSNFVAPKVSLGLQGELLNFAPYIMLDWVVPTDEMKKHFAYRNGNMINLMVGMNFFFI